MKRDEFRGYSTKIHITSHRRSRGLELDLVKGSRKKGVDVKTHLKIHRTQRFRGQKKRIIARL